MIAIIKLILIIICLISLTLSQNEQDVIDISKINQFPSSYNSIIRAGYLNITVHNQALYYIVAESQNNPQIDPVILWLHGGPACSSLIGFFNQNGPFRYQDSSSANMIINDYSWNKKATVIYLQSPSGVGFSQATKPFLVSNDTSITYDHLAALKILFQKYPQFQGNDFYLSGQGYAGIYIPRLAQQILSFNEDSQQLKIHLKGILVGNGVTHPYQRYTAKYFSRFTTQFLFTRGFVQQNQYSQYKSACLTSQSSANCLNIQQTIFNNFYSTKASIYNIYDKCYNYALPNQNKAYKIKQGKQLNAPSSYDDLKCVDLLRTINILNNNNYREAFKVGESTNTLIWTPCSNKNVFTSQSKAVYTTIPTLINYGLKVFYYSGDLDATVPIQGTLFWFNKYRSDYGITIKKSWRPWVLQNQNINGMVWQLEPMTLVTFRGAGHLVPSDKPAQAYQMLNVFLGQSKWKYPDYFTTSLK